MLSEIRDLRAGMLIRDTYRIVRKLGKGGMGAVYLAQHTLLDEPRALKFLSQDLTEDDDFTSRFLREVRTLRQVRNRNVVDCGDPERAEDGSLFFSMEFVDGPSLRGFLKTAPRPFDVALALEIARGIAEGLGAAHAKGLVHRDIKPDNILMARDGDKWLPKIADFGLVATKEVSHQTRTGSMLLSMAYAAPEQWIGTRAADLDGRTDIYALGGVLYEMVVGHTVFEAENYHEWAQKHLKAEPAVPSSLRRGLAQWKGLDALVLRMLAKNREDRPQDIAELLALLSAVAFDPTAADEDEDMDGATLVYTPKLNPASGPAGQSAAASRPSVPPPASTPAPPAAPPRPAPAPAAPASPAPSIAVARPPVEPRASVPNSADSTSSAPAPSAASVVYQPFDKTSRNLPHDPTRSDSFHTSARTTRHATGKASATEADRNALPAKKGVSVWVWIFAVVVLAGLGFAAQRYYVPKEKGVALHMQTDAIVSVAFSPNGITLATASRDNTIQFWEVATAKAEATLKDKVNAVAFSPDGRSVASADADKNVRLWDLAGATVLATLDGHTDKVLSVAFSPDGRMIASGSADTTIRLWDVASDKVIRVLQGGGGDVNSIAFSPNGRTLASGGADSSIRLWDVATGKLQRTLQGHTRPVNSVVFSPDGRTLASASDDTTIRLWDVATGKVAHTLQGHTGAVRSVAFSSDGHTLASGSADSTVRLWDAATGQVTTTLTGHSAAVQSVAINRDASVLASGSSDDSVRLWDLSTVRN
jgi:serine/threonine protein kinase/sugar lactone lactonase YvrE